MQKHDAKNAQGTSGTQQPAKKGSSNPNTQKPGQQKEDRSVRTDDDFNSSPRNK